MLLENGGTLCFKTEASLRLTLYWWVDISALNALSVEHGKELTGATKRGQQMEWLKQIRIVVILAPGLILALAGCSGAPANKTLQAEEALVAAGFQLKMADTPVKVERISRIPQKKVVRAMIKDREVYLWADAEVCRCYYKGTRQNYEQLLQNQSEEKADQHAYWYEAQHDEPLWLSHDWE
jgi:hypothetical protein